MSVAPYRYIDSDAGLRRLLDACADVDVIALDTEFVRFNTYYPILGLVQIYTGRECFLIDPLGLDLGPLTAVMENQALLKVLHACSEDMEVFQHAIGVVPAPVYDTQIGSAAQGVGFSISYQALVEHYLAISLPKDQTRSDWLTRPLSPRQLEYAALDVVHLLGVYEQQYGQLQGTEKLRWVEAESGELGKVIPTMASPEDCYLKLKGLWQLNRRQLNLLKVLCAWREVTARADNVPRNRVIDQRSLMTIARDGLASKQAFQNVAKMTPRQLRKYGDEILFLQAEAKLVPERDCPPLVPRTDAPVSNSKLKRLRQVVEERARRLSVAPELLTRRRYLEKLIRSEDAGGQYHLPVELGGWREAAIGRALLSALAEQP